MFEAIWFFKAGSFHFIIPFVDYIDMYNISNVITLTGQENNKYLLSNFYYSQFHGIAPYHFFELWLNGFLTSILPFAGTLTLMLFVYPLFYFASYIGLLAVWEHYGNVNIYKMILSFLLLFVGGMYFEFYLKYELLKWCGGDVGNLTHIWGKKSAVLYPFIFVAYLKFVEKKYFIATGAVLCLGLLSIGVMPGIAGGIILFALSNIFHKTFSKIDLKWLFILLFVFVTSFVFIYFLWGNKSEDSLGFINIISEFFKAFNITFIKTLFFRTVFPFLRLAVIFSPFIIFVLYVLFKKNEAVKDSINDLKKLFYIIVLILLTGSLVGALASINLFSGGQFFSYLIPVLIIFIIFIFVLEFSSFSLKHNSLSTYLHVFILLFFIGATSYNIYNNIKLQQHYKNISLGLYGEKYLEDVTNYLNKNNLNPLGVCFMGKEDVSNYPLDAYGITGLTFSGMSVKLTKKFNAVSNLSIFDLKADTSDTFSKQLFKSFEFYNFVKAQKKKNEFLSIQQSQIDFINHFSIDYALIYKNGVLPEALNKKIKLRIDDTVSGQSFLIFNR